MHFTHHLRQPACLCLSDNTVCANCDILMSFVLQTGVSMYMLPGAVCVALEHLLCCGSDVRMSLLPANMLPGPQAHTHRHELYYHTRKEHLLWSRRWGLIRDEIEHFMVSEGVFIYLFDSCQQYTRSCRGRRAATCCTCFLSHCLRGSE